MVVLRTRRSERHRGPKDEPEPKAEPTENGASNADAGPVLSREDAERITRILEAFAPGVLDASLRNQLGDPHTKVQTVWRVLAADTHTARQGARGRMGVLVILHMLARIAGDAVHDSGEHGAPSSAYALHMRLPSGEYFTNAVHLADAHAKELAAGGADLVAIPPLIHSPSLATLGERVRVAPHARPPHTQTGRSAFLSYGPYGSSLGPSFDSTGCTLGPEATELVWTQDHRLASKLHGRWGHSFARALERAYAPHEDCADAGHVAQDDASLVDAAVNLDPSLDPLLMQSAVQVIGVDDVLLANEKRLDELQEIQWMRVRLDYGHAPMPAAVVEREQALASDVLASLVDLLCRVPPLLVHHVAHATAPYIHMSHAVLASSLAGHASPHSRGFWGTLPDTYYGAKSHIQLPVPGRADTSAWAPLIRPAAIADNTTAHAVEHGALLAAHSMFEASPAAAVKNTLGQPRPPMPAVPTQGTPMTPSVTRPASMYTPQAPPKAY